MDPHINDENRVEIEISDIAYEGKGVGKIGGYVYFVPKSAVSDRLSIRVTRKNKNFSEGVIDKIISPSKERVTPPCPYYNECGGCHYQHLTYPKQLEIKREHIVQSLRKIGRIELQGTGNTIPSPSQLSYRTRSVFHVSREGKIGYISQDKDTIIDVKSCLICTEGINATLGKVRLIFEREKELYERVCHFEIRNSLKGGHVTVIFAVCSSINEFVSIFEDELAPDFDKCTIFEVDSPKDSTLVFGKDFRKLCGDDYAVETMGNSSYRLSPGSFFQVNRMQSERLVSLVLERAGVKKENDNLLDLYCGVGLFSVPIAKVASSVTGIESSYSAVNDAVENLKLNGSKNVSFIYGRVREETKRLAESGKKFRTVLLDPPRGGADRELLRALPGLSPEKIIYVSCSPPTFARDAGILSGLGFNLEETIPLDMFPQTYHVESVSTFVKRTF